MSVDPPDLPSDVIERALDGDPEAFRQFYRHYDPTVRWAVGTRVYRWPQLVPHFEDIVQEVWIELTRRNGKRLRYHDATRGMPFWRFVVLVSAQYGWRVAKCHLGHPTMEFGPGPDELDEAWDFVARIMDADLLEKLARKVDEELKPEERVLFYGFYVRGERLKDLGATLGVKENAICKRRERLEKKLRRMWEELRNESETTPPEMVAMVLAALLSIWPGGLGGAM